MKYIEYLNELRDWIISEEPKLSTQEKTEMWNSISAGHERQLQKRRYIGWSIAAAITFLLVFGSIMGYQWMSASKDSSLFSKLDLKTLREVKLIAGEQTITLGRNSIIRCFPDEKAIELEQDSTKFTISHDGSSNLLIAVPQDSKADVILADGSCITLRENSKMRFPYSMDKNDIRKVLIAGEAYMKISHQPDKKFIAESKHLNVTVLGTEFLLSAYPEAPSQKVSLFKGLVQVTTDTHKTETLKPNQTFNYHPASGKTSISMIQEDESSSITGWTSDILIMNNESLTKLLKRAEKYYHTKFYFSVSETDAINLSGKFDTSADIDEFLSRLEKIAPIKVTQQRDKIIIHK